MSLYDAPEFADSGDDDVGIAAVDSPSDDVDDERPHASVEPNPDGEFINDDDDDDYDDDDSEDTLSVVSRNRYIDVEIANVGSVEELPDDPTPLPANDEVRVTRRVVLPVTRTSLNDLRDAEEVERIDVNNIASDRLAQIPVRRPRARTFDIVDRFDDFVLLHKN